jgi:F1F0 ATPase subunit 2
MNETARVETLGVLTAVLAGAILGIVFFGGLWWTVKRALSSGMAAVWFSGSFLARTVIALSGFYFAAQGDWRRMVGCVAGFLGARLCVVRFTRMKESA